MGSELDEEGVVEVEGGGELEEELVDGVEELEEDGGALGGGAAGEEPQPVCELVPELHPVPLHQGDEARQRPGLRVQQEPREAQDLRRPVPAVRAVNQHRAALVLHRLRRPQPRRQQQRQVLQPPTASTQPTLFCAQVC